MSQLDAERDLIGMELTVYHVWLVVMNVLLVHVQLVEEDIKIMEQLVIKNVHQDVLVVMMVIQQVHAYRQK